MDECQKGHVGRCYATIQRAWLLNPKNYQAFWGFGAVLSEQGKLAEAIEQLETARELIDDLKKGWLCFHDPRAGDPGVNGARLPADKQLIAP